MAAAFVQAANGTDDAAGNALAAGSFTSTAGNALFVVSECDQTNGSITTVTDNKSNTFTPIGTTYTDANGNEIKHFYCLNILGGAGHVVTANFDNVLTTFKRVVVHEASGIATSSAFDQDSAGSEETGTAVTDTSVTTTTAGQYIFASCCIAGGTGSNTIAAGSGFTEPSNSTASAASFELMAEYQIQSSAGSITALFTRSASGLCTMRTSTFKAASGGNVTFDATTAGSYAATGSSAADKFTLTALQAGA